MIYDFTGRQIMQGDYIIVALSSYNDPYFNVYLVTEVLLDIDGRQGNNKIKADIVYSAYYRSNTTRRGSTLTNTSYKRLLIVDEAFVQSLPE